MTLQPLSQVLAAGEPREANFLARTLRARRRDLRAPQRRARDEGARAARAKPARVERSPLHLVFIGAASEGDRAWHLRHLVELRDGAALTLVEHHLGSGAHATWATRDARPPRPAARSLRHARVQDEADGATPVRAHRCACWRATPTIAALDLELGAGLSRHELNVALHGAGRDAARQRRAARQRPAPPRHAPGHRPRRPRHRLRPDLARPRRRPRARRVPRRHPDPRRRRRQRREPVEQEPAASAKAPRSTPSRCSRSTPTK